MAGNLSGDLGFQQVSLQLVVDLHTDALYPRLALSNHYPALREGLFLIGENREVGSFEYEFRLPVGRSTPHLDAFTELDALTLGAHVSAHGAYGDRRLGRVEVLKLGIGQVGRIVIGVMTNLVGNQRVEQLA